MESFALWDEICYTVTKDTLVGVVNRKEAA